MLADSCSRVKQGGAKKKGQVQGREGQMLLLAGRTKRNYNVESPEKKRKRGGWHLGGEERKKRSQDASKNHKKKGVCNIGRWIGQKGKKNLLVEGIVKTWWSR